MAEDWTVRLEAGGRGATNARQTRRQQASALLRRCSTTKVPHRLGDIEVQETKSRSGTYGWLQTGKAGLGPLGQASFSQLSRTSSDCFEAETQ